MKDKITIDRATVEQALEALNSFPARHLTPFITNARSALRQALQQPNEFTPDWDQIKPFNDRIAELESVAKQALEAIEEFVSNKLTFGQRYTNEGQCLLDSITALRQALEQPRPAPPELEAAVNDALGLNAQQEPVAWDWVNLNSAAQEIVCNKSLWKRFIDGTPLANDIACWMADFALEHTHPPVIDKSAATRIATALGWGPKKEWVGLTDEDWSEFGCKSTEDVLLILSVHNKLKEKNT